MHYLSKEEILERLRRALNRYEAYGENPAEAGRLLSESVRDVLITTALDVPEVKRDDPPSGCGSGPFGHDS